MSIETELGQFLKADAGVAALVVARVYAQDAPQASHKKDRIIYTGLAGVPIRTLDGPTGLVKSRIQVGCFSESYVGAKTLAKAARDALVGFKGAMGAVNVRSVTLADRSDEFDDKTQNHWVALLFSILHEES